MDFAMQENYLNWIWSPGSEGQPASKSHSLKHVWNKEQKFALAFPSQLAILILNECVKHMKLASCLKLVAALYFVNHFCFSMMELLVGYMQRNNFIIFAPRELVSLLKIDNLLLCSYCTFATFWQNKMPHNQTKITSTIESYSKVQQAKFLDLS